MAVIFKKQNKTILILAIPHQRALALWHWAALEKATALWLLLHIWRPGPQLLPGTKAGLRSCGSPDLPADVSISTETTSLNARQCFPTTGKQILIWRKICKSLLKNRNRALKGDQYGVTTLQRWLSKVSGLCFFERVGGEMGGFARGFLKQWENCCAFGHFVPQCLGIKGNWCLDWQTGGSNVKYNL